MLALHFLWSKTKAASTRNDYLLQCTIDKGRVVAQERKGTENKSDAVIKQIPQEVVEKLDYFG